MATEGKQFVWDSQLARSQYTDVQAWEFAPHSAPWLLPGETGLAICVADWDLIDGELEECQFALDLEPMLAEFLNVFASSEGLDSREDAEEAQKKFLACADSLERMAARVRQAAEQWT